MRAGGVFVIRYGMGARAREMNAPNEDTKDKMIALRKRFIHKEKTADKPHGVVVCIHRGRSCPPRANVRLQAQTRAPGLTKYASFKSEENRACIRMTSKPGREGASMVSDSISKMLWSP
jgi:hypothetical protein